MKKRIVVVCIGSNKVCGDSLGPLVGTYLREKNCPFFIYGTLTSPVNGRNLREYVSLLRLRHSNCAVIAVDAAVGDESEVGTVKIKESGILAGGALNKNLPRVGDVGIIGVVAKKTNDVLSELLSAPYSLVEELAVEIAERIYSVAEKLSFSEKPYTYLREGVYSPFC